MIKKTYTKLLLTSLVLTPYLYADASKAKKAPKPPAFETVWEKVYGGDDNDIARGVVMLEDGDSAVIGECILVMISVLYVLTKMVKQNGER